MTRSWTNGMCQHENVPLPINESVGDIRAVSQDNLLMDLEHEPHPERNCDKTLAKEAIVKKMGSRVTGGSYNVESMQEQGIKFSRSQEPAPNLQDLSNLLYIRGRLQELGCTFNTKGELFAFGNPESDKEFDQILHLGPVYDEQWFLFFADTQNAQRDDDVGMWPDLRTLKKMLKNEGIEFGYAYGRLSHGDASPRVMRLCTVYDILLKLWLAQPCNLSLVIEQNGFDRPLLVRRESGIVPNVGWQFSDDADGKVVTRCRCSSSETLIDPDESLGVAINLVTPFDVDGLIQAPLPVYVPPTVAGRVNNPQIEDHCQSRPGPLPRQASRLNLYTAWSTESQCATTPSAILREEFMANPQGNALHALGLDAGFMNTMAVDRPRSVLEEKPTKKKGLRGWWNGILGRKSRE